MIPTTQTLVAEFKRNGYTLYRDTPKRGFNLNIVGWRNRHGRSNYFDDFIGVYQADPISGELFGKVFPAATRPGIPWLKQPMNPKGAAILAPGQYRGAYTLGIFRGYTALKQVGPVTVFRDGNRDSLWNTDQSTTEYGNFGLHIHKAGKFSSVVGVWSAGCQVLQSAADFDELIELCERGKKLWGNSFTYTLLEF